MLKNWYISTKTFVWELALILVVVVVVIHINQINIDFSLPLSIYLLCRTMSLKRAKFKMYGAFGWHQLQMNIAQSISFAICGLAPRAINQTENIYQKRGGVNRFIRATKNVIFGLALGWHDIRRGWYPTRQILVFFLSTCGQPIYVTARQLWFYFANSQNLPNSTVLYNSHCL